MNPVEKQIEKQIPNPTSVSLSYEKVELDFEDRMMCLVKAVLTTAILTVTAGFIFLIIHKPARDSVHDFVLKNWLEGTTGIQKVDLHKVRDPNLPSVANAITCLETQKSNYSKELKILKVNQDKLLNEMTQIKSKMLTVPASNLSESSKLQVRHNSLSKEYLDGEKTRKNTETARQLCTNKITLLEKAREIYIKKKCDYKIQTYRLDNEKSFVLDASKSPSYFKDKFNSSSTVKFTTQEGFYNYSQSSDENDDIYVDFANVFLGGGCFTHGFVMEEVLVHEFPDLAEFISQHIESTGWCTIQTRKGDDASNQNRVLNGNPKPLLIRDVHRVQALSIDIYGKKLGLFTEEQLKSEVTELSTPQAVTFLAIAAPKLYNSDNPDILNAQQWNLNTVKDLFNTVASGMALSVEQQKPGKKLIFHSGKIGCGAFLNDPTVVYLVQRLAAQQKGVDLKLWGYNQNEIKQNEEIWNKLQAEFKDKTVAECLIIISKINPYKPNEPKVDNSKPKDVTSTKT